MTRAARRWLIVAGLAAIAALVLVAALFLRGGELVVVKSALARGIPDTDPAAYWPLEGHAPTSGITDGPPMVQSGQIQYATQGGNPASGALPDFTGGGSLRGTLPNTGTTDEWRYEFVVRFGTGSDTVTSGDFTTPVILTSPSGDVNLWEVLVSEGIAVLNYSDFGQVFTGTVNSGIAVDDGQWHHIRVDVAQSGANISATITVDDNATSGTLTTKTLNSFGSRIDINANHEIAAYVGSVGHLTYWAPYTSATDTYQIATGHLGEAATTRFARICAQYGIAYNVAT